MSTNHRKKRRKGKQPAAKATDQQPATEAKPAPDSKVLLEALQRKEAVAHQKARRRVLEALTAFWDTYVDPEDAYWDADSGTRWDPLGSGQAGRADQDIKSESDLQRVRTECRNLAATNEFAINGHENRISYIVGSGHSYSVKQKPGHEVGENDLETAQTVLDEFCRRNKWHKRQQEIVWRKDRDGECFLRFFPRNGTLDVRFVEPGEVKTPEKETENSNASYGILTDPDDVETVRGYFVSDQLIAAEEIQHRKANVDSNVKRGIPLFHPVRKNLQRAEKLQRNMSVAAEIQTAIAFLRKHSAGTKAGIEQFVKDAADQQVTNTTTGVTKYSRHYGPGSILDVHGGMEYEFPSQGIDASRYVVVKQAELRAVASRLVMPEFMLSSDASNANYASTMVAEGPAVKMFERLQWGMIEDDLEVMERVLDVAAEAVGISDELRASIEIDVEPPRVQTRDRLMDTQADVLLAQNKALSVHTLQLRHDLDPEFEGEKMEEERSARRERTDAMLGLGQFGGQADDENEGDDAWQNGRDD